MLWPAWRWRLPRSLLDDGRYAPFPSRREGFKRVLFLSERDPICLAQIFPFFLFAREFTDRYRIEMRELPLRIFLENRHPYSGAVDAVCFQTWFDLAPSEMESLCRRIKLEWPDATIAYLDWFAPIDMRFAEVLNGYIQAYVKKQILRDLNSYGGVTLGDTNLTDFYARRFHIDLPEKRFPVPEEFKRKLVMGWGFEYSSQILNILKQPWSFRGRSIDLQARIATEGTDWYSRMRQEAQAKAAELDGRFKVAHRGRLSNPQYLAELRNSKMCFSPFGYGEVCWRDFEAMSTGALLIKPDMSHLRLANDFFRAYETYVPLAWDLHDLAEKIDYYVQHPKERKTIARNAVELLSRRYRRNAFLKHTVPLWQLLGLN